MSDLINRQDAIRTVCECECYSAPCDEGKECYAVGKLRQLPSADRPQGEWEIYMVSPFDGEDCRCSECGQTGCAPYWDYCPNCGCRMKGADDETYRCK